MNETFIYSWLCERYASSAALLTSALKVGNMPPWPRLKRRTDISGPFTCIDTPWANPGTTIGTRSADLRFVHR